MVDFIVTPEFEQRFWQRVQRGAPDVCWLWLAGLGAKGYGRPWVNGKRICAHRVAYRLACGPFDDAVSVCHRCDTPACCNPAHLFPGTHADNMRDMATKGRSARGERHGRRKLTLDDVRMIRARCASGEATGEVALDYGLNALHVWKIITRRSWAHA